MSIEARIVGPVGRLLRMARYIHLSVLAAAIDEPKFFSRHPVEVNNVLSVVVTPIRDPAES